MHGGRGGRGVSNREGWTNQSKAYSQLGYTEKPLWTLTLEITMKDKTIKQVQCWRGTCGKGGVNGGDKDVQWGWWVLYT
jgi:hypothetical protein